MVFLAAENKNRLLESSWKICYWPILALYVKYFFSVGKDKVNNWEFCLLKSTSIVVFVIIQRIELWALVPTHITILIRELSILLF